MPLEKKPQGCMSTHGFLEMFLDHGLDGLDGRHGLEGNPSLVDIYLPATDVCIII